MRRQQDATWLCCRAMGGVIALVSFAAISAESYAAGPVKFTEHLLQGGYGYAYGLAAGDLDGDGRPEITTADGDGRPDIIAAAERGANEVRWWHNEGPSRP